MKKHKLFNIILIAFLPFFCLLIQDTFAGDQLVRTPADYEGPFYPITKQLDIDNNLTQVKGQAGVAKGDILNLSGIVVNTKGEPFTDITIEIWQTDPQGRYKHPGDSTPGERDPYFQYWGAAVTDKDGTFFFKTVLPGAYEPRPAHIHYKVLKEGKVILTSQIYFMKPSDKTRLPSMTSGIELQTVDLESDANEEFEAFFRIVI
jgi:protocatechuate 3,4-dioxygenase beta subunit